MKPREEPPPGVKLPTGSKYLPVLRGMFAKQQADCLHVLDIRLGRKGITKDIDPMHIPGEFYDFQQWDVELAADVKPVTEFYWDEAGKRAMVRFGLTRASFSVRPPGTQAAIDQAAFSLSRSVNQTTHKRMAEVVEGLKTEIADGLWHGDTHGELIDRVKGVFEEASDYRAHVIAGTEAARAVHMGALDAAKQSQGLVIGKRWLLSGNPCPLCVAIAEKNLNKTVGLDASFGRVGDHPDYAEIIVPPAHPQCVLPGTRVLPVGIMAALRAEFNGPAIRIIFASGDSFAVTSKHMLLTPTGFARAKSLVQGDDVLRYCLRQWKPINVPDNDWQPPVAEQVIAALSKTSGMASSSVPVAAEHLHGDARFCNGKIDVVRTNSLLRDSQHTTIMQPTSKQKFQVALNWTGFAGDGEFATMLESLRDATDGGMGRLRERKSRFWGHARNTDQVSIAKRTRLNACRKQHATHNRPGDTQRQGDALLCLASGVAANDQEGIDDNSRLLMDIDTNRNASGFEPSPNSVTADTDRLSNCLQRFAGLVTTDKIIDIQRFHYCGPVYDFETSSSLYVLEGGIVSSNCMCSMEEVLAPEPVAA